MRLELGCRCQNLVGEPSPYSWGSELGFLDALLPEAEGGDITVHNNDPCLLRVSSLMRETTRLWDCVWGPHRVLLCFGTREPNNPLWFICIQFNPATSAEHLFLGKAVWSHGLDVGKQRLQRLWCYVSTGLAALSSFLPLSLFLFFSLCPTLCPPSSYPLAHPSPAPGSGCLSLPLPLFPFLLSSFFIQLNNKYWLCSDSTQTPCFRSG